MFDSDRSARDLGLKFDEWSFQPIRASLEKASAAPDRTLLAVLGGYADALESQAAQRNLLLVRLRAFESVLNRMLVGKEVRISSETGFEIETSGRQPLTENELSSGEYHLLYLMVCALETRHKGTVIAIDEPEMSMHISWQRQLVRGLLDCASNASPQLLLATHSPDIAADFPEAMVLMPTSQASVIEPR